MPEGPTKGHVHPLDKLLPQYYEVRGWENNGVPSHERLNELEL